MSYVHQVKNFLRYEHQIALTEEELGSKFGANACEKSQFLLRFHDRTWRSLRVSPIADEPAFPNRETTRKLGIRPQEKLNTLVYSKESSQDTSELSAHVCVGFSS